MKREVSRTQLPDTTQALKGGGIDQCNGERFGWVLAIQADGPMQRIVIGAGSHQSACSSCCSS
jgi:hypothetical protein